MVSFGHRPKVSRTNKSRRSKKAIAKRVVALADSAKTYRTSLLSSTLAFLILTVSTATVDFIRGLNPSANPTEWIAAIAVSCSLFLWLISTSRISASLENEFIKSRFDSPKIGIITSRLIRDNEFLSVARCSEFPTDRWVSGLTGQELSAEPVEFNEFDDFDLLVNPFGERYLESDIGNMTTLKHIRDFVAGGGVYVNTGGLAFFYMYDPVSRHEGLTGSALEYFIGGFLPLPFNGTFGSFVRPMALQKGVYVDASSTTDTWLYRTLGVRTTLGSETSRLVEATRHDFADLVSSRQQVQEFRAIERCESNNSILVPVLKSEYRPNYAQRMHECYPIAAVKHGLGYFVICGMVVKDERHKTLVESMIKKLCILLCKKGNLT